MNFKSQISAVFKVDPAIKYGLREAHRLFVGIVEFLAEQAELEDLDSHFETLKHAHNVVVESAIIPKLSELLKSLNIKSE